MNILSLDLGDTCGWAWIGQSSEKARRAQLIHIRDMLGHKSVETTQRYLHVTNPELQKTHKKFHDTQKPPENF